MGRSGVGFWGEISLFTTVLFRTCFEQGVPWHSGNHRLWVHSETGTWHDKNIQSIYHESELDCRNSFLSFSNKLNTRLNKVINFQLYKIKKQNPSVYYSESSVANCLFEVCSVTNNTANPNNLIKPNFTRKAIISDRKTVWSFGNIFIRHAVIFSLCISNSKLEGNKIFNGSSYRTNQNWRNKGSAWDSVQWKCQKRNFKVCLSSHYQTGTHINI